MRVETVQEVELSKGRQEVKNDVVVNHIGFVGSKTSEVIEVDELLQVIFGYEGGGEGRGEDVEG